MEDKWGDSGITSEGNVEVADGYRVLHEGKLEVKTENAEGEGKKGGEKGTGIEYAN